MWPLIVKTKVWGADTSRGNEPCGQTAWKTCSKWTNDGSRVCPSVWFRLLGLYSCMKDCLDAESVSLLWTLWLLMTSPPQHASTKTENTLAFVQGVKALIHHPSLFAYKLINCWWDVNFSLKFWLRPCLSASISLSVTSLNWLHPLFLLYLFF